MGAQELKIYLAPALADRESAPWKSWWYLPAYVSKDEAMAGVMIGDGRSDSKLGAVHFPGIASLLKGEVNYLLVLV